MQSTLCTWEFRYNCCFLSCLFCLHAVLVPGSWPLVTISSEKNNHQAYVSLLALGACIPSLVGPILFFACFPLLSLFLLVLTPHHITLILQSPSPLKPHLPTYHSNPCHVLPAHPYEPLGVDSHFFNLHPSHAAPHPQSRCDNKIQMTIAQQVGLYPVGNIIKLFHPAQAKAF